MSIRINRVYTKSGDDGTTGLVGGHRIRKTHVRILAVGEIDETNATLGVVKEEITPRCAALRPLIEFLQQELFDLGSEVATPPEGAYEGMWRAGTRHVENLEKLCDHYGANLPELTSFILPGGTRLAAALHLARTVARRAERSVLSLLESMTEKESATPVGPEVVHYLNRLSDLLFVLARWSLSREGQEAPLWVKESSRKSVLG